MKKIIFYLLFLTLAFALPQCKVKDERRFRYTKIKNEKSIKSKMKPKIDSLYVVNFHLKNWKYEFIGMDDKDQILIETVLKTHKQSGIGVLADTNLNIINATYHLPPVD